MSSDQAHISTGPPDHKDISGEEAWARRCSLPDLAPWTPQTVKTEGNDPQDTLPMHLPSTLHEVEEGEILDTQPYNSQSQSSEAHSFLYSIPQWQPPSMAITAQQHSQRPHSPVPAQKIRPLSARIQGLQPPSLPSIRTKKPPPTRPRGQNPSDPLRDVGYDENIPNIYRNDVLDRRIGIRPRHKNSKELQLLKDQGHARNANGASLPRSMKVIIQQFMVANGYVFPHLNLTTMEFGTFRNSLMIRLDLHKQFEVAKETQQLIKSRWGCVDAFVAKQSRDWQVQGVFKQVPETAGPAFAAFTKGWTDRTWDGSTPDIARARALMTRPPVLPVSPTSNGPLRPKDSENSWEAPRQVIVLDIDTEGPLDGSSKGLKPTLKRPGQDSPNNRANKRARSGDYTHITTEHKYVDHLDDGVNGLDVTTPEEKGLPMVIEAICHARNTLLDFAPMTAKDLADTQQDWVSHGFTDKLSEILCVGRAHILTMGKYFDHALELVSFLKDSDHWEVGDGKVQVDCSCQQGSAAPEQLQNGRVPIPSVSANGEGEIRHSRQQEDAMQDQSPDGKVSDRPIFSTRDIRVARPSWPKVAVLDRLHIGIASDTPVAMTEKGQVDHLYKPTASTIARVQNNEVAADPPKTPSPCEAMGVSMGGSQDEKSFFRHVLTA